jgi:hypothetical protein
MNLLVVINTDLGWDNIVGIFDASKVSKEELEAEYLEDQACIVMDWFTLKVKI